VPQSKEGISCALEHNGLLLDPVVSLLCLSSIPGRRLSSPPTPGRRCNILTADAVLFKAEGCVSGHRTARNARGSNAAVAALDRVFLTAQAVRLLDVV